MNLIWVVAITKSNCACSKVYSDLLLDFVVFECHEFCPGLSYYITDGEFKKAFSPFGDIKEGIPHFHMFKIFEVV